MAILLVFDAAIQPTRAVELEEAVDPVGVLKQPHAAKRRFPVTFEFPPALPRQRMRTCSAPTAKR